MATVKISSKVEESDWKALQALARESHQNISGLFTEAIRDYDPPAPHPVGCAPTP